MKKNNMYLGFILCVIFMNFSYAQNSFWKPANGPYGAIVNDIGISQDSVIYLATEGRGLLKSIDSGDS